ncbi:hypothetical protein [Alkalinema sp. FACHB-956]|uniref:hypothetical protein n=1 Tax=Alkalinema sp. FACHB-956 TaxID=2692768 RepID=UPI001685FFB4|nr:hypothetical protein [Alkalinema sp. FACHB-956]MBD2326511.1 hypothetical protein [Alkalinema sp. FACHB-956]
MGQLIQGRKVGLLQAIAIAGSAALVVSIGSFWLGRLNREAEIVTGSQVPVIPVDSAPRDPSAIQSVSNPAKADTIPTSGTSTGTATGDATAPLAPAQRGNLRISNQSEHPVRIALRFKADKMSGDKTGDKSTASVRYEPPAHWDFAPGEGSDRGLVVALPGRAIQLKKGDILVAFAQDGSQRYWGPFIVGETDEPLWNPQTGEWKLTLEN